MIKITQIVMEATSRQTGDDELYKCTVKIVVSVTGLSGYLG